MKQSLQRFFKYFGVGASTFLFDLAVLFVFIDVFRWNYIVSAGASFLVAISLNYYISRRYVFHGSLRSVHAGYLIFIIIALVGLFAVAGGMLLFVQILGWHYISSRIVVALLVGIWNYAMNLYVNFRVAGKHGGDIGG